MLQPPEFIHPILDWPSQNAVMLCARAEEQNEFKGQKKTGILGKRRTAEQMGRIGTAKRLK